MWETRLGGRIEATSALSAIHKLIVVGKFIKKSGLVTWRMISFFCCIYAICFYSTVWICWSTLSMMPPCIFELDTHLLSRSKFDRAFSHYSFWVIGLIVVGCQSRPSSYC